MADYTLTVFEDDETTVLVEVGTAAAHAHPYLHAPDQWGEAEIDLENGKALIGQANLRVIDPQNGADQTERFLTALLGNASGFSAINGRRALWKQVDPVEEVLLDGVAYGISLNDTYAGFTLQVRDIRERGRAVSVFQRTGTSTVFPRGVLDGYGRVPSLHPPFVWLAYATTPVSAKYIVDGDRAYFTPTFWSTRQGGVGGSGTIIPPELLLTSAMLEAGEGVPLNELNDRRIVYRDVEIGWRASSIDPWTWLKNVESWGGTLSAPTAGGRIPGRLRAHQMFSGIDASLSGDVPVRSVYRVDGGKHADGQTRPSANAQVEILVRYVGPASESYPLHFEGTWGTFVRNLLRGDYCRLDESGNPIDPKIRYDESLLTSSTGPFAIPIRVRITETEKDLRTVLEEMCKAIGAAPALNADGEIAPIRYAIPDASVTVDTINDDNAQAIPGWDHPADNAVTVVEVTYPRDYAVRPEDDPNGDYSAGDGIASLDVTIRKAPDDLTSALGEQELKIDAWMFRALGGTEGQPVSGDVTDEMGSQIAEERAHQALDRFGRGGQTSFVKISTAEFPDKKPGDWLLDGRSWRPNYLTGERGGNALAQIVSLKRANPAWWEARLIDSGPADAPLDQPDLGTVTASLEGIVSVPIDTVPADGEARVDYAISDTLPGANSADWIFLGRVAAPGTLLSPALPQDSTVWIRSRGEGIGRRPSAWTSAVSVDVPVNPRIVSVVAAIDEEGIATVEWLTNGGALGVRIYFAVHMPGEEPTLSSYIDADASDGEATLPITVLPGQQLTVEIEPWTGWTGSAVSGSAGVRASAVGIRVTDNSTYGLSNVREVPPVTPGNRRWEWDRGPGVDSVWYGFKLFPGGEAPTEDEWEEVSDIVEALPDGQDFLELAAASLPAINQVGALQLEPRKADLTVEPGEDRIRRIPVMPRIAHSPTLKPRLELNATRSAADVFVTVSSYEDREPVRLRFRDSETSGATEWVSGYAASGTEFGPATSLTDGVTPTLKLNDIGLSIDAIKRVYVQAEGQLSGLKSAWVAVPIPAIQKPQVLWLPQTAGATSLSADGNLQVRAPYNQGGTLSIWTNKAGTNNANTAGAADATISVPSTPATYGAADSTSLNDIPVFPGRGKIVAARFVSADGGDSGIVTTTLHSALDILGSDGKLIPGAVDRPAAFAASLQPPKLIANTSVPGDFTNQYAVRTTDKAVFQWNGSAWVSATLPTDYAYFPAILAGAVSATELAAAAVTAAKLNVASAFVAGLTVTDNSPGAGSIAWSACTVTYQGTTSSVASGNTSNPIVWWDRSAPTSFKTSTEAGLISDGYDQDDGDAVILLNESGAARQVWNGTLIYGGQIVTDAIRARHLAAIAIEVGKYIRSTGYVAGSAGWNIEGNGDAEFNDVVIRGILELLTDDPTNKKISFVDENGDEYGSIFAVQGNPSIPDLPYGLRIEVAGTTFEVNEDGIYCWDNLHVGEPVLGGADRDLSVSGNSFLNDVFLTGQQILIGPSGSGPGGVGRALYLA